MLYLEALQQLWENFDPFTHIKKEEVVDETELFFVIPARAPYVPDHLLIIPKRKVYVLKHMTPEERLEMYELIEKWASKLHKKHKDINLLLRDGLVWQTSWKSVNHLHFHLIPDCEITTEELFQNSDREFFDDEKYAAITKSIKEFYL